MKVSGLSFSYPDKVLFQNLNLEFAPHSKTLIQGVSGSGKSTFLKLVAGLTPLQSGEVQYEDTTKIAYLHQDCHLVDHWSLSENLSLVESSKELQQNLALKLGLQMSLDKKASTLSGGERQRLSLARIFLQKADLVLLDEPTAHLDDEQVQNVLGLIKSELKSKTVLIVSHDARLKGFADKTVSWQKPLQKEMP